MNFRVLIILISVSFTGCAFLDQFVAKEPPALTQFGYPDLVDVPSSAFERIGEGRLAVSDTTIMDLGRNTAKCLNVVESYSLQVSTYNEFYGKESE